MQKPDRLQIRKHQNFSFTLHATSPTCLAAIPKIATKQTNQQGVNTMKKLVFGLVATVAIAATSLAGTATYSSGKTYKEYKQVEKPTCFSDTEIQADIFGAYAVGERGEVGLFQDHGWGGGVGVNYIFARYFGVGVDGYWLDAKADPSVSDGAGHGKGRAVHDVTGSLIFRYPIDSLCLAPYIFAGGGGHFDGEDWASAHVGGGLEYRIVPNKVGIFTDGRWTYLGDRYSKNDLNFTLVRAGVRWIF
jgi:opacity protein-like surface antigen